MTLQQQQFTETIWQPLKLSEPGDFTRSSM